MKLRRVWANKETFHEVEFFDGFNVVLADVEEDSGSKDTRNGVGKSTLIEIVHFCLGSRVTADQRLYALRGTDWEFTLELAFHFGTVSVSRSLDDTSRVRLGGAVPLSLLSGANPFDGPVEVALGEWNAFLGVQAFSLTEETQAEVYKPAFRALMAYFARRGKSAFVSPFEARKNQLKWQTQVYNSYLLGLDWRIPGEWQNVRDKKRAVDALSSLPDRGEAAVGNLGELEAQRVALEVRLRRLREQVDTFSVLPEYREVEERVNQVTSLMRERANQVTVDKRAFSMYQERIDREVRSDAADLVTFFGEVQVSLGESVKRTLEEVVAFHEDVTRSRAPNSSLQRSNGCRSA